MKYAVFLLNHTKSACQWGISPAFPSSPAETRGLAGLRVPAQPWSGHRMPFGNCWYFKRFRRALTKAFGYTTDRQGVKICDLLIFYYRESSECNVKNESKIICLAESKSTKICEAIEQIEHTYSHIKDKFKDEGRYNNRIAWCAYIAITGPGSSLSLRKKEERRKLDKIPGFKYCDIKPEKDIGKFLRKCWKKLEIEKIRR